MSCGRMNHGVVTGAKVPLCLGVRQEGKVLGEDGERLTFGDTQVRKT